ncbi:Hypothetical predicted protein, partial [Pelobates cultripes]
MATQRPTTGASTHTAGRQHDNLRHLTSPLGTVAVEPSLQHKVGLSVLHIQGLDLVPTKAFLTHEPLEDVPRTTTPLLSAVHQPGIPLQAKIGIRTEGTS